MLQALKKLALLFLFPATLAAQGIILQNFSQGTVGAAPTVTDMTNSLYGTLGTCCASGQTPFMAISNSNNTLTYSDTSVATDGGVPSQYHSGHLLDYNTTQGNGHNNQIIFLRFPNEETSIQMGGFWFVSNIPVTDSFGTTNDFFEVINGGASRLANYISNGSAQTLTIEGCTTGGAGSCSAVSYTPGHTVWIAWQQINGGACNNTDHTDCVRFAIYDRNLSFIGEVDSSVPAGTDFYETFGNGNAATMSNGHHMQFSDIWSCTIGCTASMFPILPTDPKLGIITSGRGIDWTQAGISATANSGTLPDSAWTQCGSTVSAGTSAASVQTLLNACSANTYLLLGSGTFTWTAAVSLPPSGNRAVRGSGADSTLIVMTGSSGCPGQISAAFCMSSSDHNYTTLPPATIYNWTAGYAQGTNKMTLSSVTGIVVGTLLFSDQCDTGSTGAPCSGTVTDNGNYFVCGAQWSSPNGCSMDGPDSGGMRNGRNQLEAHAVTAINGSVVTVSPPISNPNFASGQTPQVYVVQPLVNSGVENLSIDLTSGSAPTGCVDVFNAYHWWVSGIKCVNNKRASINVFQGVSGIIQNSYFFNSTGTLPSNYGLRLSASSYVLVQNNILTRIQGGEIFYDGACVSCVSAYNYAPDSNTQGADLTPFTEHSGDQLNLWEGNIGPGVSCDNIHGTCDLSTRFRNFWTAWNSVPSTPVTSFTNGTADFAFARYIADIANVQGTPTYHTTYTSTSSPTSIYNEGTGGGSTSVPVDSLTKSTTLKWGGYDTVTNFVRFCGNSLDSNWTASNGCNSVSESPVSASTYPNLVPVVGDTLIGQPPFPASFYLTSKPSWFGSAPWPGIGPDISSGNVGICSGTLNTVGFRNGVPALTLSQCLGNGIVASAWGHHVNANPAMLCALNTMGMAPDGSSSVLSFNADSCYSGGGPPPSAAQPTFSPNGAASGVPVTVTISTTTPGAIICWNATGAPGPPATNGLGTGCNVGTLINGTTGNISVSVSQTVFAVAGTSSLSDSTVGSAVFTIGTPVQAITMFAGNASVQGRVTVP